jgi:hypothetical protein
MNGVILRPCRTSYFLGHLTGVHSVRRARMGSMLAARPAGTALAASATTATPMTAIM